MKSRFDPRSLISIASLAVFALTGCSGAMSFPDAPINEPQTLSSPPIRGSVFGGHAPIVGAQVYILSLAFNGFDGPGTTPNSLASGTAGSNLSESRMYGDAAIGTPTGTGNGAVRAGGLYGYHYVTTDNEGYFNLTGDYNCGVDAAIYIVAVGGSATYGSTTQTFGVSTVTAGQAGVAFANGAPIPANSAVFSFTTSQPPEEFYDGEPVTFSQFTGAYAGLNSFAGTIYADSNLSTTVFDVVVPQSVANVAPGAHALHGNVTGAPVPNPAIINMAALGLCPAAGNFAGSNPALGDISFIYMNEVSTTALAYATAGFGTDAFHIGAPFAGEVADTTYFSAGIVGDSRASYTYDGAKAALYNAANIYDITGSNVSTSFAGEGHIARSYTPGLNGTVPQATVDTIGDILAACVDSNNTSTQSSAQCSVLFHNATLDGTATGTPPTDIATAAFNIAHHPSGVNNRNFVKSLYGLPTGVQPFEPSLSSTNIGQPNDFSIQLAFTAPATACSPNTGGVPPTCGTSLINSVNALAVDGENYVGGNFGNVGPEEGIWIVNNNSTPVKLFTRTGIPDYSTNTRLSALGNGGNGIAIDYNNNAWITNGSLKVVGNTGYAPEFNGTTAVAGGAASYTAAGFGGFPGGIGQVAIDPLGNAFVSTGGGYTQRISPTGLNVPSTTSTLTAPEWSVITNTSEVSNYECCVLGGGPIAVSAASAAPNVLFQLSSATWMGSYNQASGGYIYNSQYESGGLHNPSGGGGLPGFFAVDRNNIAWVTNSQGVYGFSQGLGYTIGSAGAFTLTISDTSSIYNSSGTAVDGSGNIWVGSAGRAGVSVFSSSGTALTPDIYSSGGGNTNGYSTPPSNQLATGGLAPQATAASLATPVIDRAGNVWMGYKSGGSNYFSSTLPDGTYTAVYEIVGAAVPIATPTAFQAATSILGVKP